MNSSSAAALGAGPQDWLRILARYREPQVLRSVFELAITVLPFVLLWLLSWMALHVGYWLSLALSVPTAGFLTRLFMIQHDCGHGAFFRRRATNDWVGRLIGVLTLTPYGFWRRTHAAHHATAGNLAERGMGDIDTLTVEEYAARPPRGRFAYRLYRHPIVLFVLGPAYLFVLRHRLPFGLMRAGVKPWISAMGTNVAIAAVAVLMAWLVGIGPFLLIHGPVVLLAAALGGWLFYVQHQFETTYWEQGRDWSFQDSALHGSSHYVLPGVLAWFTANIGVHHVHHLCSRIPFYRLPRVLRDHPELAGIGKITLTQSLRTASLALWDEKQRRLVPFPRRARRPQRVADPADRPGQIV
jgi:omega-6 fatty acid desaturase (delta-12 desaturase)